MLGLVLLLLINSPSTIPSSEVDADCWPLAYYMLGTHGDWKNIYIFNLAKVKDAINIEFFDESLNEYLVTMMPIKDDCSQHTGLLGDIVTNHELLLIRKNCCIQKATRVPINSLEFEKVKDIPNISTDIIHSNVDIGAPTIKRIAPLSSQIDRQCFAEIDGFVGADIIVDHVTGSVKALIRLKSDKPLSENSFIKVVRLLRDARFIVSGNKDVRFEYLINFKDQAK